MTSILQTAAQGMYQAAQSVTERAQRISSGFSSDSSQDDDAVIVDIVGLKSDEQQYQANAKVVKVSQSLDQAVLDIVA